MQLQLPPEQVSPTAQASPQPPQCEGFASVSTQVPPQSESPPEHTHAPVAVSHILPDAQVPQEPPQPSSPHHRPVQSGTHIVVQLPATQLSPGAQAAPQPPQFAGSVIVSTQLPPQSAWPIGQMHAPDPSHD
jgi:hypothetical protein